MIYECIGNKAAEPYYIEQMCINIYTMEELLYFLKGNACLLDGSIINGDLIAFIGDQLGLKGLCEELKSLHRKNRPVSELASAIFNFAHYLSDDELIRIRKIIEGNSDVRPFVRKKSRADFFFQNRMYAAAGEEYAEALEECDDDEISSDIYRHLAAIYIKNFMFREAAGYLKKEWEITKDDGVLKLCLLALKESGDGVEYKKEIMDLDPDSELVEEVETFVSDTKEEASKKVAELDRLYSDDRVGYIRKSDEIINGLKTDYRRDF